MSEIKNKLKNNALFFTKIAIRIKKNCTFAACFERHKFLTVIGAVFSFNTERNAKNNRLPNFNGCCTERSETVSLKKQKKGSLSLFKRIINKINFSVMRDTLKNANGVNNSNPEARVTHEKCFEKRLNITGVKNNIVLFLLRKSFREFLNEESKGYLFTDLRLKNKIEAVRLLFPEYRSYLTNLEERGQYV